MNKQTLTISGITCHACVKLITNILSKINGVTNVLSVDHSGQANVSVTTPLSKETYLQAFAGTPYRVESVREG